MDKQAKILQILQEANKQADALTATQAKQLVDLLVSLTTKQVKELVNQFNQFSDSVSQETFKQIQNALIEIREKANTNQLEVRQLSNKNKKDFETAIARANDLILELQSIEIPEPEEVDTEAIINETLSRIPEPVAETPSQVIEKINKSKKKIKKERIEGLDKVVDQDNLDRAISILDQRTQFLINKRSGGGQVDSVVAGTNISVDNTDPQNPIISSTGGSGAVNSVNGQTGVVVLDTDDISDTATSRYTNDTDITRLANTSGTNTGDQDLSSYAKLTDTAQDITANSFITDGGTSSQFVKGDGSLDGSTYITGNQTITLSGDVTGSGTTGITTTIANGAVDIAMLSATGSPSSSTYLRGDNTWATVSGGASFGTDNQIPFTNAGGTDFDYSANFTFDGTNFGVDNSSVVFNESGADVDFRIEGDTNVNLFNLDASANKVGIGMSPTSATYTLQTAGNIGLYATDGTTLLGGLINNSGYMALSSTGLVAVFSSDRVWINGGANVSISSKVYMGTLGGTPTAVVHLKAGTASAGTAPLKFTSGTNLTTEEDGAMEYNGSHLYFTIGSTRYQLDQQGGGSTQVWNETPTGLVNSSNTIYTTASNFASGTTRVFLNGVRQVLGTDYTETDTDEITFATAPVTADSLIIDYQEL